jgi:protein-S-isoprenylcysteine O-methyltransferase Ste14
MSTRLFFQAILKFALGVLLVGALLFLPAGTLCFARGWVLMGILFVPMFLAGVWMMCICPDLLARRLNAKETRMKQGVIVKLSGLMFIAGFVLAGLGRRFHWYTLPWGVTVAAAVIFLLGYALYAAVLRENRYLSRTIEVQEGQSVVSTGPYRLVRHPMYTATLLLFLSMPLVLGSLYAVPVFLAFPALLVARIQNEEELLAAELPGHTAYRERVRWRLIPFLW